MVRVYFEYVHILSGVTFLSILEGMFPHNVILVEGVVSLACVNNGKSRLRHWDMDTYKSCWYTLSITCYYWSWACKSSLIYPCNISWTWYPLWIIRCTYFHRQQDLWNTGIQHPCWVTDPWSYIFPYDIWWYQHRGAGVFLVWIEKLFSPPFHWVTDPSLPIKYSQRVSPALFTP